jgi:hypothetical protein
MKQSVLLIFLAIASVAAVPAQAFADSAEGGQAVFTGNTANGTDALVAGHHPATSDFLSRKKREMPSISHLLADLTKWLSNDSTLERLSIDENDKFELQGLASDTAKLLSMLHKSDLFIGPTVVGTPKIDLRVKKERFTIVADLRKNIGMDAGKSEHAFLSAADSSGAFSEITQRLEQAMGVRVKDEQSCTIVSKTIYREAKAEPYPRVTVQVRLRCDLDPFVAIVSDLEKGSPYLFVSQLELFRQQGGYVPPGGQAQPTMDIRFNLSGYQRKPQGQR